MLQIEGAMFWKFQTVTDSQKCYLATSCSIINYVCVGVELKLALASDLSRADRQLVMPYSLVSFLLSYLCFIFSVFLFSYR